MKRVTLDTADTAIQDFVRGIAGQTHGVELELDGQVICKVIPVVQFSPAERDALIRERRDLMRRARERNKGVPQRVLEREIREAVDEVRSRNQE